jgi:hypothetical protein
MLFPENTTVRKFLQTIAFQYYHSRIDQDNSTDDDFTLFFLEENKEDLISMIQISLYELFSNSLHSLHNSFLQEENPLKNLRSIDQSNINDIYNHILMLSLIQKNLHLFSKENLDEKINQNISDKINFSIYPYEKIWI